MPETANPSPSWHWAESGHWELKFHGLPRRFPWHNNQPPPPTGKEPNAVLSQFPMEHLYRAMETMMKETPEAQPDARFLGFMRQMDAGMDFISAMQRSDFIAAEGVIREMERTSHECAYLLFNKAFVLLRTERAEEALECYRRAVKLQPDAEMVWMRYGEICEQTNKKDEAIHAYHEARRVLPNHEQATLALERLGELIRISQPATPDKVEWLTKAELRVIAEADLTHHWNDAEALRYYGGQHLHDKLFPVLALRALERAVELDPASAEGQRNLGAALRANGRVKESFAPLHKAATLEPANAWTPYYLAESFVALGDMKAVWEHLGQALKLDRNHKGALKLKFLQRTDRTPVQNEDDLAEYSRPGGGDWPGSWRGFLLAADQAWNRGAKERGVKFAAEAYGINPEDEGVFLTYTGMLSESGENEWVAALCKPRLRAGETNPRAWWNFARALDALGLREEAIQTLRKALAEIKVDAEGQHHFNEKLDEWTERFAESEVEPELHSGGISLRRNIYIVDGNRRGPCLFENGLGFPARRQVPVDFKKPKSEFFFTFEQQNMAGDPETHSLGTFIISEVDPARITTEPVKLFLTMNEGARLVLAAKQGQRKLRVQWALYPPPRHDPEDAGGNDAKS